MRPALLALSLALTGCVTTSTTTRTWGEQDDWVRYGRVVKIRETIQRADGNPGAGAVAGAVVGGLLGSVLGGHGHYDRWGRGHHHGSAAGAVVGAIGGAAVGAAASQGRGERRLYEVMVRFHDGARRVFTFEGGSPFEVGDEVALGRGGLSHAG